MNSNINISNIVQGFWRLLYWNYSTKELIDFLNQCIDLGVSTFDTAEIYSDGKSEEFLGEAIRKSSIQREQIQIVSKTGIVKSPSTKFYDTRYQSIIEACKKSLFRLKTDYIDLYLIHRQDPCMDFYEVARALEELTKEGLIKAAGVSNFNVQAFSALNKAYNSKLTVNQIEVNPLCFEYFENGMLDYLQVNKITPMIWSPLAGGKLFIEENKKVKELLEELAGEYNTQPNTIAIAWLLYHPSRCVPISGSKNINRLKDFINAFDINLSHEDWYRIYTASTYINLK